MKHMDFQTVQGKPIRTTDAVFENLICSACFVDV